MLECLLGKLKCSSMHYVLFGKTHCFFFRGDENDTFDDQKVFALNLFELSSGVVRVMYGWNMVSKMQGAEQTLIETGVGIGNCYLRAMDEISCPEKWEEAKQKIQRFYCVYRHHTKEQLLALRKELMKEFVGCFHKRLKPLGFHKKGNVWRRKIDRSRYLELQMECSSWTNEYSLHYLVDVDPDIGQGHQGCGGCLSGKVYPEGEYPHEAVERVDWQLLGKSEIDQWIEKLITTVVKPLTETPLEELGKERWIQAGCACRKHGSCPDCWVERNMWKLRENEMKSE